MVKKPRKWKPTLEDSDFMSTDIRVFSLDYPSAFDDTINGLKDILSHPQVEPGLTVVEWFLRRLEKEAKNILQEYGYPTDITELVPRLQEGESFRWTDPRSGKTIFHKIPSLQAMSAKQILCSAENIRNAISKNDAEETAIETMRLLFAAMAADLRDTIMDGSRLSKNRKIGGEKSGLKKGILLATCYIMENKKFFTSSAQRIWNHFKLNYNDEERDGLFIKIIKSDDHQVTHYKVYPGTEVIEDYDFEVYFRLEKGKEKVFQINKISGVTSRVTFSAFRQNYVKYIKKIKENDR